MQDFGESLAAALGSHAPTRTTQAGARKAAVLIPVVGEEPAVIFTVRTNTLPSHKGQISFPGGSIDAGDDTPLDTALREAHEEIGLPASEVRVVGELDTFPTYVTGYVVTPFVGWIEHSPELTPNPAEVAEILQVPLSELTDSIRAEPGFTHAGRSYPTEAWVWNDYVIWGVTARILRKLLTQLGQAGLVEAPGPDPWANFVMPESPPPEWLDRGRDDRE
jgi:8-oxo-dGTP pyrophosphatase MutT (NUDIX family)